MRRVERTGITAPPSLTVTGCAGALEMERYAQHEAEPSPKPKFTFRAYKAEDVRHSLEALFHGKCAYCESRSDVTAPVDVEHFRPKGAARDGSHNGYWWLAATWSNLLPSCIDCNRRRGQPTPVQRASLSMLLADQEAAGGSVRVLQTGKESCFPVCGLRLVAQCAREHVEVALASECALLLDPSSDNPVQHLMFHIDHAEPLGIVFAKGSGGAAPHLPAASSDPLVLESAARAANVSVRGAVSIQVYGLNRLRLVQERTRVLRQVEFMAALMIDISETANRVESLQVSPADVIVRDEAVGRLYATADRLLAQIRSMADPDAPFSAMVAAWIASFIARP